MRLPSILGLLLLTAQITLSHFILTYPPSLGFTADNEDQSPCGGYTPSTANTTDYAVQQNSLAFSTLHPQSTFLFRATLDTTAKGNWTNLLPIFSVYGLGSICETDIVVDQSFVGQVGLLQAIQHAEDGVHYQCATVKFVDGSLGNRPSACTNASGTQVSFVGDSTLSNLGNGSASSTSTSSSAASSKPSQTAHSSAILAREVGNQGIWAVGIMVFAMIFGFCVE